MTKSQNTSEQLTEQWVNIYKSKKCGSYWSGAFCYKTKEEAVKDLADKENYLTTINIEEVLELKEQNAQLKERVSKLEKMQYSYTPEEWNMMLRTVNRTKELLKECSPYVSRSATSRMTKNSVGFKKDMKLLTKIDEVLK